ncbi:MAG: penicillin-insensitive murein endopeptidase [Myxococcota bacterium]
MVAATVLLAPLDVASAPPASQPIRPALRARVALSVGAPNAGRLVRGEKLEPSTLIRIVPAWGGPDFRWGLPQLVGMLRRAAAKVSNVHGDAKMCVGDLSSRTGGTLRKHKSHQSGRDADIGFYMLNARGEPIYHHRFVAFDAEGRSSELPGARFDDARNWTLIESLLQDPEARVQWVFVSDALRTRLLREAERRGASRQLRLRAARVMKETKGSSHDDHFHVRIDCPKDQRGTCEPWPRRVTQSSQPATRAGAQRGKRGKRRR